MNSKSDTIDKELALRVVRTLKEAEQKYRDGLTPNDIPVIATRINWDFIEKILEDL